MHTRLLTLILIAAGLSACATRAALPSGAPPSGESPSGTTQPEPPIPGQAVPAPPEQPAPGAPRQFHLGPAASALVTQARDRKSTRLNSSHDQISYAVFCLKKKKNKSKAPPPLGRCPQSDSRSSSRYPRPVCT